MIKLLFILMIEIEPQDVDNIDINLDEYRDGNKNLREILSKMDIEELAKTFFVYSSHRKDSEMYDVNGMVIEERSREELISRGYEVMADEDLIIKEE